MASEDAEHEQAFNNAPNADEDITPTSAVPLGCTSECHEPPGSIQVDEEDDHDDGARFQSTTSTSVNASGIIGPPLGPCRRCTNNYRCTLCIHCGSVYLCATCAHDAVLKQCEECENIFRFFLLNHKGYG